MRPSARAAFASAYVAVWGSRKPSPGTQTLPKSDSGLAAGISARVSSGDSSSTSRPIPLARETPRWSLERLAARRDPQAPHRLEHPELPVQLDRVPTERRIVGDGLNIVTSPAAWAVDPLVSSPFSIRSTSVQPARARCRATLQPVTPPPITTALPDRS